MIQIDFNVEELKSFIPLLKSKDGDSRLIHFNQVSADFYNIHHTDNIKYIIGKVGFKSSGATLKSFTFNLEDFQKVLGICTGELFSLVWKEDSFYCFLDDNLIFMGNYEVSEDTFLPPPTVWNSFQGVKKIKINQALFLTHLKHLRKATRKESLVYLSRTGLSIHENDLTIKRQYDIDSLGAMTACFHASEISLFKMFSEDETGNMLIKITPTTLLIGNSSMTRIMFIPNRQVNPAEDLTIGDVQSTYPVTTVESYNICRVIAGFSEDAGYVQLIGDKKNLRARLKNDKFKKDSILTLSDLGTGGDRIFFFTLLTHLVRVLGVFSDDELVSFEFSEMGLRVISKHGIALVLNRNRGIWV
jgi:hypothetical protein